MRSEHVLLLIGFSATLANLPPLQDYHDYEYDPDAAEEAGNSTKGGFRLVGASRADTRDTPFVIGYTMEYNPKNPRTSCTGSLITASWMVSAVHCVLSLIPKSAKLRDCVIKTKSDGFYSVNKYAGNVKCAYTKSKDVLIKQLTHKGVAFVNIKDVYNAADVNAGQQVVINYMVVHANTYRGGGTYGDFGGYDIVLLRLTTPISNQPACLPSPTFIDNGIGPAYGTKNTGNLAGYGKYARAPCMTDQYGPSKYHYCSNTGGCILNRPPPSDPICDKFFAAHTIPGDQEEIVILEVKNRRLVRHLCYRKKSPLPQSKGWCKIEHSIYDIKAKSRTNSWGFCSKDCFLSKQPDLGVLRRKDNVDILDDELCKQFLKGSLPGETVKVMPEILCVGFKKKLQYSVWGWVPKSGKFKPLKNVKENLVDHPAGLSLRGDEYIHSAGTCHGDSGGPVYTKDEKSGRFVVLGAVSGGRGHIGNCGGINNPTHYARLKAFGKWITKNLGKEAKQLCFV